MLTIFRLFVFVFLFVGLDCYNITDYLRHVEDLSLDENFVEEYLRWSRQLYLDADYLYGPKPSPFPCSTKEMKSPSIPTSVHSLRPGDIQCVAALGDSITAGMGAHAFTPIGVLAENRGVSWSIGGDHTYNRVLTLPNILRLYNPNLKGFSTKTSISFLNGQNAKHNGLNVAKSGARSYHLVDQADLLIQRLKEDEICDWNNDWKLITLFIGGNDLCGFCDDLDKHSPSQFTGYIRETLDRLYSSNLPRTLVNIVLVLDVRFVEELNSGGLVCNVLHRFLCPCAAFPSATDRQILNEWIPQYQNNVTQFIQSGRYDQRDDFTVVVQPFLSQTQLPRREKDGKVDFSYFAPDCFHFSGKGHSVAALSLWNNMFEPVGQKQRSWHKGEPFKCPTDDHPFISTSKNSL